MKNFTQKFIGIFAFVFAMSFSVNAQQIGDIFEGGIVFQVSEDGTGLVADLQDLGYMDYYEAMSAAESSTSQGYDDWRIPSYSELYIMYIAIGPGGPLGNIGEFLPNSYLSSSIWQNEVEFIQFGTGGLYTNNPLYDYNVRAIRDVSFEYEGCMDATAFNFNPIATSDDGSCIDILLGCMDTNSPIFNSDANTDDGSCVSWEELANNLQFELDNVVPEDGVTQADLDVAIAEVHAMYEGWCESDIDNDGICDVDEVSGCGLVEFVSWPTNAGYGSTVSVSSANEWSFTQPGYEAVVIQGYGDQLIVEFTNLDGSYTGTGVAGYWNSIDDISASFGITVAPNILPRLESNEFVFNQEEPYYVTASSPSPTTSVTAEVLQNNPSLIECVIWDDMAACEDAASQLNFNGNPFELMMNMELEFCLDYGDYGMCEMAIQEYFTESCSSVQSIYISESGCTDPQAQNYNENVAIDDGSCISWAQIVADLQADVDAAYADGVASVTPEDGITQADVDYAYMQGQDNVNDYYMLQIDDLQSDLMNCEQYDVPQAFSNGAASVTAEDGIGQADVDAAYAEGAASVTPEDGITQADVDASFDAGVASVEVPECEEVATQNMPLDLPQGWSMFGYTCLESLDVVEAFSGVSDNIEIVKDEWGLAYLPAWGFSAFDNLEFGEGYQIKMMEEVTDFQFCSTIIGYNTDNSDDSDSNSIIGSWGIYSVYDLNPSTDEWELELNAGGYEFVIDAENIYFTPDYFLPYISNYPNTIQFNDGEGDVVWLYSFVNEHPFTGGVGNYLLIEENVNEDSRIILCIQP